MYEWMKPIPKYKNRKCVVDGIEFDSRKEANRYMELPTTITDSDEKPLKVVFASRTPPHRRATITARKATSVRILVSESEMNMVSTTKIVYHA